MEEFLTTPAVKIVIGLVLLGIVWKVVARLLQKPQQPKGYIRVRCVSCGWAGQVGKFNRRCSACGGTVVDTDE